MKKFVSHNFTVSSVIAPASKSVAQRYLLASALSHHAINLTNIGFSDDVFHIKSIVEQLGSKIENTQNITTIIPRQNQIKTELNCGESGLGIRLTTPIASTFGFDFKIDGKGSLCNRPLNQFEYFLPKMGVNVSFNEGKLPLILKGKLKGGEYIVDGGLSSQYISGLLMALPLCESDSVLHVKNPTSTPYIDITLDVLNTFGIEIKYQHYKTYHIKGNQKYNTQQNTIHIEGDWSGAAFWIVYGLIKGKITIKNLKSDSTQADKAILKVVKLIGSDFEWDKNGNLTIIKKELKPFYFDATNCPDLFPILVVLAASISGTSTIVGVNRLKHKESDRGAVLQNEFKKLGLKITIDDDIMTIFGTEELKSGSIDSNNDHRIAMSGAIASVLTSNGITILQSECVNKSYPEFWDVL